MRRSKPSRPNPAPRDIYEAERERMKALLEASRAEAIRNGEPLLTREQVIEEVRRRRGGSR